MKKNKFKFSIADIVLIILAIISLILVFTIIEIFSHIFIDNFPFLGYLTCGILAFILGFVQGVAYMEYVK